MAVSVRSLLHEAMEVQALHDRARASPDVPAALAAFGVVQQRCAGMVVKVDDSELTPAHRVDFLNLLGQVAEASARRAAALWRALQMGKPIPIGEPDGIKTVVKDEFEEAWDQYRQEGA